MYKRIFFSLSFFNALCMVLLYIFMQAVSKDTSAYGLSLSNDLASWLLFHSQAPFKNFVLPLIFSFYTHLNLKHLGVNLVFYLIVSSICEQRFGYKKTFALTILIHVITLALLVFITPASLSYAYSGASAASIGLLSFLFITRKQYVFLSLTLLMIYVQSSRGLTQLIYDPHFMSCIIGVAFALALSRAASFYLKKKP